MAICTVLRPTVLHIEPEFFGNTANVKVFCRLADHVRTSGGLFSARLPAKSPYRVHSTVQAYFGRLGVERPPWQMRLSDDCQFGVESDQGASDASYLWLSNFDLDPVALRCRAPHALAGCSHAHVPVQGSSVLRGLRRIGNCFATAVSYAVSSVKVNHGKGSLSGMVPSDKPVPRATAPELFPEYIAVSYTHLTLPTKRIV